MYGQRKARNYPGLGAECETTFQSPRLHPTPNSPVQTRLSMYASYFFPIIIKNKTSSTITHIGDKTHHQDHAITPHNFNTMKVSRRRPGNVMPLESDLELILFIFSF